MEILWWLAAPAAVTVLAMVWVSWIGRAGRGEVDRDVAVQRLAEALRKDPEHDRRLRGQPLPGREHDRSTGIAVRPTRRAS